MKKTKQTEAEHKQINLKNVCVQQSDEKAILSSINNENERKEMLRHAKEEARKLIEAAEISQEK